MPKVDKVFERTANSIDNAQIVWVAATTFKLMDCVVTLCGFCENGLAVDARVSNFLREFAN